MSKESASSTFIDVEIVNKLPVFSQIAERKLKECQDDLDEAKSALFVETSEFRPLLLDIDHTSLLCILLFPYLVRFCMILKSPYYLFCIDKLQREIEEREAERQMLRRQLKNAEAQSKEAEGRGQMEER